MTCVFLHDDVATFVYKHHTFYFSTPRRLANFNRCLSFSVVPEKFDLGTVILDIREFSLLRGINDVNQPVAFIDNDLRFHPVVERDSAFSEPYDLILREANWRLANIWIKDEQETRNWVESTYEREWENAIKALHDHHRVQKLIIRIYPGDTAVWAPNGILYNTLRWVGQHKSGERLLRGRPVQNDVHIDFAQNPNLPRRMPAVMVANLLALWDRYGWQ